MERDRQTIYNIAERAGVSIATVSRVLRGSGLVSEKTRCRVEEVIDQCHYRPSAYARGLSQRHTKTLGIILPKINNPNYTLLFEGAYDEAAAHGYVMTLFPWENMNAAGLELTEVLGERRLDGVVICLEHINEASLEEWRRKLRVLHQYMEVVLIGSVPPSLDYPSVTTDLSAVVRDTVRMFINQGHERISLLGGFDETGVPGSRDEGYRAALREAKLPYINDYRVFGYCTAEDGRRQADEVFARLVPSQWPTAIIAANDMVALGVLRAACERGLRVPEEMSLIGCDDTYLAAYTQPPLATVNTHQREIGRRAVQMLLDETAHGRESVAFEIITRSSCAGRHMESV